LDLPADFDHEIAGAIRRACTLVEAVAAALPDQSAHAARSSLASDGNIRDHCRTLRTAGGFGSHHAALQRQDPQ